MKGSNFSFALEVSFNIFDSRFSIFDLTIVNRQSAFINQLILPFKRYCANAIKKQFPPELEASSFQSTGFAESIVISFPSGPSPEQDPSNFQTINYKYDLYGRRSEKKVDGFSTRYLYDGPQVIAEYDGNNNLLRKYIYGPGIDQPVCMIEVADSNAVYYYHFDALGSVVALSDSSGDTVQTYEYSVFGQVAVEDINHPNPYMFAGRRFDIETGLYYNRARYYNPFTGRFLQTDPIGYGDGMNMYMYCGNNPLTLVDPSGKTSMGLGELAIQGG